MTKRHYFAILLFLLMFLGGGLYWYGALDRPNVQMLALPSPATYETVTVDKQNDALTEGESSEFSSDGDVGLDNVGEGIQEETFAEPVTCMWVGDGFTPRVAGASPLMENVAYDSPIQLSGYDDIVLPLSPDAENANIASVCATLMFDIGADGMPIDVTIYEVVPTLASANTYYAQEAVRAVNALRWQPGARNGKPVRVNQNTISIRFGLN